MDADVEHWPCALFVYGTLKRGHCNHYLLQPHVCSVERAWIGGRLVDLGPFPAMLEGGGRVAGELIHLSPDTLEVVLAATDALEGWDPADPNGSMYARRVVGAESEASGRVSAYAYYFNQPEDLLLSAGCEIEEGEWHGASSAGIEGDDTLVAFGDHVRACAQGVPGDGACGYPSD